MVSSSGKKNFHLSREWSSNTYEVPTQSKKKIPFFNKMIHEFIVIPSTIKKKNCPYLQNKYIKGHSSVKKKNPTNRQIIKL